MPPSDTGKEERSRKLFQAILMGDVEEALYILTQPVDFGYKEKGDNPIHMAARMGQIKVITVLLEKGDKVNRYNENHNTPLHYAAKEGHLDIVTFLIQKGANTMVKNKDGDSPLHFAVAAQHMEFVEKLLAHRMSPNEKNNNGHTPLHVAVQRSRRETMEVLLIHKANPNIKDKDGHTAADVAKDDVIANQLNNYVDLMIATDTGTITAQGCHVIPNETQTAILRRVGVIITSIKSTDTLPFQVYCRREKSEDSFSRFKTEKAEEIVSDIFHFRVFDNRSRVSISTDVPLYTNIGVKEQPILKFLDGEVVELDQTLSRGEVVYCSVDLDLTVGEDRVFVVFTRPRKEDLLVDTSGITVVSQVNEDFQLDIPESTFGAATKLSLTVFDTNEAFEPILKKAKMVKNLLTDVYQVNVEGQQPSKEVAVSFPMDKIVPGDDIVIITADESNLTDENCLEIVPSKPTIENQKITFNVNHFCIHVAVPRSVFTERRQEVFNQIVGATRRQRPASFFIMTMEHSHTETVVLVEVSAAGKVARRIQHWEGKGYERHGTVQDTLMLSPSDEFTVTFNGNITTKAGKKRLIFFPKRASFQPYRVSMKDLNDAPSADAVISESCSNNEPGDTAVTIPTCLAVLKFSLPTPPPPLDATKANKFDPHKSDIKKPLILYLKRLFAARPWIDYHQAVLEQKIQDIMTDFGVTSPPVVMVTKTVKYAGTVFQDWRDHTFVLLIDNIVTDTAALPLEQLCEHVLDVILPPGGIDTDCLKLVTAMRCCAHQLNAFLHSTQGTARQGRSLPVAAGSFWKELKNILERSDLNQKKVWKQMETNERARIETYKNRYGKQTDVES